MSLTVTMKIFSGRPNPVWILPDEAANEFNDRLRRIASTARISNLKPAGSLAGLGYRGMKIQQTGVANAIYIHAGVIDPGRQSPTYLTEDRELERWIFATGQKQLSKGVQEYVERSLQYGIAQQGVIVNTLGRCPASHAADAPLYDQKPWWQGTETSESNNCYNYANNKITNTFAQPGRASGNLFTQENNCADPGSVLAGAVSDSLVPAANFSTALTAGQGWYVALVLWPGHDFHWYRQDANGCWSGKMGDDDPTSVDNSHNKITDPKTADRSPYTVFCSYMITRCGVKIS